MQTPNLDSSQTAAFINALEQHLYDPRDRRGKRHNLAFIVCAVAIAIMAGRASTSSIFRFIRNRIDWLVKITGVLEGKPISRAHLPRLLAQIDWSSLNPILEEHFDIRIEFNAAQEWTAIDGKTLRGTTSAQDKKGQRILLAVTHTNKTLLAQKPLPSKKAAEVTQTQILLHESGLEKKKVTLDALHLNPRTTQQIHQAGGKYIIQAKGNQSILQRQLVQVEATQTPVDSYSTVDKGHGRLEVRRGRYFDVSGLEYAKRWSDSGFATLVVMERKTTRKQKITEETSYYLSNQKLSELHPSQGQELFNALRNHWQVESDNWVRDVTFQEDSVRTKSGEQAQVMAGLRTLAMGLFRKAEIPNMRAALDDFCDDNKLFGQFLARVGFL
jgi:predicted transposase YbfD/YdcC